jgi:hypothetical protein
MHHLQIMESLGGDSLWLDRFMAQHGAIVYYWVLIGAQPPTEQHLLGTCRAVGGFWHMRGSWRLLRRHSAAPGASACGLPLRGSWHPC